MSSQGWVPLVWSLEVEIHGQGYSATVREYCQGVAAWVVVHDDGYLLGSSVAGTALTPVEAMGACEDWIDRMAMGEDATT